MKRFIPLSIAALAAIPFLTAGTARGEVFFSVGGVSHFVTVDLYKNYQTPLLLQIGGYGADVLSERRYVTTADFNGDGYPDVAFSVDEGSGYPGMGFVRVLNGKTFTPLTPDILLNPTPAFPGSGSGVAAGDLNGDGIPDLIVGPNGGIGGFTTIHAYSGKDWSPLAITFAPNGDRVAAADFNHDNIADVVTSGTVYNGATGSVLFTFPASSNFAVGDINGDGTPDIGIKDASGITFYSGINQQVIKTLSSPTFDYAPFALADVNNDGIADVATFTGQEGIMFRSGVDNAPLTTLAIFPTRNTDYAELSVFVTVPEPASLGVLAFGTLCLTVRRRTQSFKRSDR